jgi:two-component system, sensor histidine kinase YesM
LIVLNINQEYLEQNIYPSILVYSDAKCIVNTTLDSVEIRAFISDTGEKGRIKIGGIHYLATKRFDPAYNLTYVNLEEARQLYGFPLLIIAFTIILCLAVITTGGVFMFRDNQRQQQNIDHLLALFKRAQSREKIVILKTHPEGRYETLVNNIVSNFIENEYLQVQLSERIYKARMLELLALQNQINPHFLFNTLDAINWRILASYGSGSPAVSMMQDLAVLLKYSFAGSNKVTLIEELDCIKTYFHLQKLRSRNGIEFLENIDLEVANAEIPKMILQPIIENSIYHSKQSIKITLTITQKLIDDGRFIIIQIADNGTGIDTNILEELRKKILESPTEEDELSSNHIGLVNTYRRIVLFFGEKQCTCTLESIPNFVTSVTFTFPYRSFSQKDEYSISD